MAVYKLKHLSKVQRGLSKTRQIPLDGIVILKQKHETCHVRLLWRFRPVHCSFATKSIHFHGRTRNRYTFALHCILFVFEMSTNCTRYSKLIQPSQINWMCMFFLRENLTVCPC